MNQTPPLYTKTVSRLFRFRNKTHLIDVKIEAFEDYSIIDEDPEIFAGLESGEYVNISLSVTASLAGIEGDDSLGNVVLSSGSTFQSELEESVNENGMVESALVELIIKLNDTLRVLT
jgi:hypothetical protein